MLLLIATSSAKETCPVFQTNTGSQSAWRLETKLDKVSIDKETTRFTLRETLCKNDAVMKILNLNDTIPANESLGSRDFGKLGGEFSFEGSNVSIGTLLNRVIRDSQTKYWMLMRHGEQKQYLMLNL